MLPDRPLLLGISETATPSVTKTSHTCGPLPLVMLLIFFEPFRITILDLEPNPDFQIFLYISETYYSTFNFNTSTRRSQLGQHFISFEAELLQTYEDVMAQKPHFSQFLA